MRLLLEGGLVVGPEGPESADVLIEGGKVADIGGALSHEVDRVIDCDGAWIGPGFVDLHVHLREPGQEWKEDIATGSAAAAAGGFTTIVAMPNTDPPTDAGHLARYVVDRGRQAGLCRVLAAGTITLGRAGAKLAHFDDLRGAGVLMFTDDGDTVADAGLLRRAMEYVSDFGGIIAQHAEDPGLARGGHMHEGSVSARLGMIGLPALAEEVVVARDLRLVEMTGCRYHVQHVSTAGTVELVRSAKQSGLPVTAEVAPHHLAFDHRLVEAMDPVAKMYPPLRAGDDVEAVRAGVVDGTIDCVATDHAPHSAHEKDVPFEDAPRGVIGLETAAAVVHTELDLPPATFFRRMSSAAAEIMDLDGGSLRAGGRADVVVFRPDATWTPSTFQSRSANSPWLGKQLRGKVTHTIANGFVTWEGSDV